MITDSLFDYRRFGERGAAPTLAEINANPAGLYTGAQQACALARALQHSTPPLRTHRTITHQPFVTDLMAD